MTIKNVLPSSGRPASSSSVVLKLGMLFGLLGAGALVKRI
jgi:hypothetical protein